MPKYNTTLNSCDCPDRKFRKDKPACKHMERIIEEAEYNERFERAVFNTDKRNVVGYKTTLINPVIGEWCGCGQFLEFGLPCVHIGLLKSQNLTDWSQIEIEED